MTKEVLVSIKGVQAAAGEAVETPELVTTGVYSYDAPVHRLFYEEVLDEDGEITTSELLFTKERAELKKEGAIQTHLIFEKGKKNLTFYQTPYGEIAVETEASAVELTAEEDIIRLHLEYSLVMNGVHAAEYALTVTAAAVK